MAVKLYPVQETMKAETGYRVRINGIEATLDAARVSRVPYNRRWPGHQRDVSQTELAAFLSFATDGPVDVEIEAEEAFEKVVVRPLSLGIMPEAEGNTIRFRMEKAAYVSVEPYGRRNALHLFADEMKTFDVRPEDEGVIYYGPGVHDAGMIEMTSGQTLFIDEGAVVYACIHAIDAENIRIIGHGILDNSRNKAVIHYEVNAECNDSAINNATRLHTVQLEYCTNVLIDGITIRDSLVYNVRPVGCKNLEIRNVKIIGCWRFNSDGIDMHNCENVLIENCFLRTFDDSICIKGFDCYYDGDVEAAVHAAMYRGGKAYDVFRNVLVRRCVVWNDWGKCLEIGAETRAEEICDVVFEDCDVIHVTGAVLDCMNVDYADVHDITWRNIRVEYDDVIPELKLQDWDAVKYEDTDRDPDFAPQLIRAEVMYHHEYSSRGERRGRNRNLLFEDIHVTGRQPVKMGFEGIDGEHACSDVTVRRIFRNGEPVRFADGQVHIDPVCRNIRIE